MSDQTPESPILDKLNSTMRCAILTNSKGEILIIHDKNLDGVVDYIEYDPTEQSFSLIFDDGRMQDLGLEFDEKIKKNLLHGAEVNLVYMESKVIQSSQKTVFLIREI